MIPIYYAVIALAIAVMLAGLVMAVRLLRIARGGKIGGIVRVLLGFIVFFTAGYLVAPWLPRLPREAGFLLVGLVFLFGAIYVVLVLWLIGRLIRQVMDELKL